MFLVPFLFLVAIVGDVIRSYDGFVRIDNKVKHGFDTFKWSTGQIYQVGQVLVGIVLTFR